MTDRALKIELFDQVGWVARALGSGRRVEIVDVLGNGEQSVEELPRQVAFNGPAESANVGYACGLIASLIGRPAQVFSW